MSNPQNGKWVVKVFRQERFENRLELIAEGNFLVGTESTALKWYKWYKENKEDLENLLKAWGLEDLLEEEEERKKPPEL